MMHERTVPKRRAGFALPAAIVAIVVLSALVAGTLFVSIEELRSGRSDMADQRALAAVEWALERAILDWDARRNTGDAVGATAAVSASALPPNDSIIVTATRASRHAVWLTASARVTGDGSRAPARRAVGASLRLVGTPVSMRAALTTLGGVTVDAGTIDGRDQGAGADTTDLCAESVAAAGVALPAASGVTCITCSSELGTGVFGVPPVDTALVADSSLNVFGGESARVLSGRASIELLAGTFVARPSWSGTDCSTSDPLNWGDPSRASPCADWLPIIHVRGGAVLGAGSVGQGILIVDGALRVESGARFIGVVYTSGAIDVSGLGAEIVGVAFAESDRGASVSRVVGGGAVRVASCAVRRAVLGSARLARTPERWWVELR